MDDLIPNRVLSDVRAQYLAVLERLPLPLYDLGRHVLQQITPQQWTLEWALPYWLSAALQLSSDISARLILCNVFGLAYIRLQDDLIDGETAETARMPTLLLAHQFYQEAILNYLELFHRGSPFWNYFKMWLDEWVAATLRSNESKPIRLTAYEEQDYLRLAQRGSPLKICCAATCLLANRANAIGSLSTALDYALVAAVLFDHLQDWAQDLDAGRYNTFVAYASDLEQVQAQREANRAHVLETFYIGDRGRPYLELIRDQWKRAKDVTLAIEIPQFPQYLDALESRAICYYDSLIEGHHTVVRDVTEKLFGPFAPNGGSTVGEKGGR